MIGSNKECLGIAPEVELHIFKVFTNNHVGIFFIGHRSLTRRGHLDLLHFVVSRCIQLRYREESARIEFEYWRTRFHGSTLHRQSESENNSIRLNKESVRRCGI